MSGDVWQEYADRASGITLSPMNGSDHVVTSVLDQIQAVRDARVEWWDVPAISAPPLPDGSMPAGDPWLGEPHGSPSPDTRAETQDPKTVAAEPEANGFVEVYSDPTPPSQEGALAGLTFARKDMVFREGRLCECGSPVLRGFVPDRTASVLLRLDSAGATEIGRLHMAELALSPTGRNNHLGPGRNPFNPDHVSGGSSSGSGIAAATRAVHFTLGSDTGGSVRIPAAACGVTGFKPTQGVLPLDGTMPLSPTLDCLGVIAPSARTVSSVFDVLAAPVEAGRAVVGQAIQSSPAQRPTILLPTFDDLDELPVTLPAVEATRAVAQTLGSLGYDIEPVGVPELGRLAALASLITASEAASTWGDRLAEEPDLFYLEIRRRIERGFLVPAPAYISAIRLRRRLLQDFLNTYLPGNSLLLLPTTPGEAPSVESSVTGTPAELEVRFGTYSYWTRGFNYLGLPGISVPAGLGPSGLPLGVQLLGRPYSDRTILAAARDLQGASDWHTVAPLLFNEGAE